ncbi:hypothetical protein [Mesorhizobium sp. CN2-181]|uniref:tyrosine-type recombinase/integrase n=1 Tax=Mesorhizobium yinganensis TaxID=3157707 RepID=UPI0032B7620C
MTTKTKLKDGWPSHVKFTKPVLQGFERLDCQGKQRTVWDTEQKGLCVLVSPKTARSPHNTVTLRVLYYLNGKAAYLKIGRWGDREFYRDADGKLLTVDCANMDEVRRRASEIRNAAGAGRVNPKQPNVSGSVDDLIVTFISEHASQIKSGSETERILRLYVLPEWKGRNVSDISKADITTLLNKIADKKFKGPKGKLLGTKGVADAVRAQLSKFFNWYSEDYNEEFRSPFVKIKRRAPNPKRERALTDAEIAAMWTACNELGVYGACVQTALLTAQRFFKVGSMRRSQIQASVTLPGRHDELTGEWISEQVITDVWDAREKSDPANKGVSEVPLSTLAKSIIDSVPIIDADARDHVDFVFTLTGKKPFNGWSNAKVALDREMLAILKSNAEKAGLDPKTIKLLPWQHRDLRRTARTLLSRAGVNRDVAERCLAHVVGGVEGVYNRHSYLQEKQDAFARLAKLVDRIVNPTDQTNVVPFPATLP